MGKDKVQVEDKTVVSRGEVDNQLVVVNQVGNLGVAGQQVVDNRMVVVDQQAGGGGGVAGQGLHHAGQARAGQALGVDNQQQGRSVETAAEFGDVAQYRELNAIGTGKRHHHDHHQFINQNVTKQIIFLTWFPSIIVTSVFLFELTIDRRVTRPDHPPPGVIIIVIIIYIK